MSDQDFFEVEERKEEREERSRSFIFPLILIALGIFFLLRNTGVITADVWETVLRLWPLLLVAIGLDSLIKREGLVGSVFWLALGGLLLLANLGVLDVNVWSVLFSLWPLLLIAIGLDLVLGRRTLIGSVIASILIMALLAGSVWFLVAGQPGAALQEITYGLDGAAQGRVDLNPSVGSLRIAALDDGNQFVEGVVYQGRGERIHRSFSVENGTARLGLDSEGFRMFGPAGRQERWNWDLGINPQVALDLNVNMGVGEAEIDLRELNANDVDLDLGVGRTTVWLPAQRGFDLRINGGVGETIVVVPAGAAVRILADTAIAISAMPQGYTQEGDNVYTSPAYAQAQADERIQIRVNQAIGRFVLREE